MAPYQPFASRLVTANLWLTTHHVVKLLQANPLGAALLHTTTAPTMLAAGVKDNVLPQGDRERIHGVDERVALGDYAASVGFFVRLPCDAKL